MINMTSSAHKKLDEKAVSEIRRDYLEYRRQVEELTRLYSRAGMAQAYGVSVRTIDGIIDGRTWRHVK